MPWFDNYLPYPPFYSQYGCVERGRRLFKQQCSNCHTVTEDEKHSEKGFCLENNLRIFKPLDKNLFSLFGYHIKEFSLNYTIH